MRYFARVTAGLEEIAWAEIAERPGAKLKGLGHRRIDFNYHGSPCNLLALRSVDDIYVYVAQFEGLDHTRQSLAILTGKLGSLDFSAALKVCASVRKLPELPGYSITASYLGKRNYSRYDLERAAQIAITGTNHWQFVPNQPGNYGNHQIDIRLLLEGDRALIGLRLGATPLHRRSYKVANLPGSLKPTVAFCLVRLAELQPGEIVLDPMCGAGTIPLEAAACGKANLIVGGDNGVEAIEAARQNGAVSTVSFYQGDVRALPLAGHSIHTVITNLPWGQQVAPGADLAGLYQKTLKEFERVLVIGGRAVLLSDQLAIFGEALKHYPGLKLEATYPISLFGRHPLIYILRKWEAV